MPVSKDALGLLQRSCNPVSYVFHLFKPQHTGTVKAPERKHPGGGNSVSEVET